MSALLLGSISTVVDTSELQRGSFNEAFAEHGLDWLWEREEYQSLLTGNGGESRIADYAKSRGEEVDAAAVHATKSRIFQDHLAAGLLGPRPGVVETCQAAKGAGWKLGLVTTTSIENVDALFTALGGTLTREDFDVVVDAGMVTAGKPDPAAYELAVKELSEDADQCVAVEDNTGGVSSAAAAGVRCVAFANENTAGHDFGAVHRVSRLEFEDLDALLGNR